MFREIKNTKVFEQVIEQIKEIIKNGELSCGDKLPSERDLCEQLNVSRTSVREALRSLEMLGIVECRHGEGNFIKESFESSLLEPLSITFLLHGSKTNEILELRKIIEPETAALAAKNISNSKLKEIKELVDLMNNEPDSEKIADIDKKIHYKIVQASENYLVTNVMYAVSYLVDRYIEDVLSNMFKIPENKSIIIEQHKAVVDAIEEHNALAAASAMKKHLEYTNDFISKSIKKRREREII